MLARRHVRRVRRVEAAAVVGQRDDHRAGLGAHADAVGRQLLRGRQSRQRVRHVERDRHRPAIDVRLDERAQRRAEPDFVEQWRPQAVGEGAHVDPEASLMTIDVPERLPRLPAPIELAIYRVVQEAIANVVRHSRATRLSVAARLEDDVLAVWVIDNGRGFRPEQLVDTEHSHLGLVSMRERAAFARGRLDVESSPGRGTRLCLRVPINSKLVDRRRAVGS